MRFLDLIICAILSGCAPEKPFTTTTSEPKKVAEPEKTVEVSVDSAPVLAKCQKTDNLEAQIMELQQTIEVLETEKQEAEAFDEAARQLLSATEYENVQKTAQVYLTEVFVQQ
jgi:hypothetical protein